MLCEVYVCGAIRGGVLSYELDCKHYWCLSHYCIIKKKHYFLTEKTHLLFEDTGYWLYVQFFFLKNTFTLFL